ncbi:hypothetical protein SARC_07147 [Sphaeroforma arctica JP610]|uniref:nitric-oxide synthase (NADPH) n=1 Tax=Sphaeroforma arctica JP610 TaxID=667725 RepID=A0A0L0FUF5_9EUKA|nr:hypothetical protein SARC_07147 [Sphaeroforma arctica JP610]KNC80485.1 hypothetical protein SARC_07147 [Sphaeroforma arctica JP610]|eukprot:XP_014154387.1 hypothetical protein SARC_07147 [Sphaeroforma arctica JP610]
MVDLKKSPRFPCPTRPATFEQIHSGNTWPAKSLKAQEIVLVKETWNKSLAWISMVQEAWVQRVVVEIGCGDSKVPFGNFFPVIGDYLIGITDIAVRALDAKTEIIARESYSALHPNPSRRYQTFQDYAMFFTGLGWTRETWETITRSFIWALQSHGPYLDVDEREDLALGDRGILGRFFRSQVVSRALSSIQLGLLSDEEAYAIDNICKPEELHTKDLGFIVTHTNNPWGSTDEQDFGVDFFRDHADQSGLTSFFSSIVIIACEMYQEFEPSIPQLQKLGEEAKHLDIPCHMEDNIVGYVASTLSRSKQFDAIEECAIFKLIWRVVLFVLEPTRAAESLTKEAHDWVKQMAFERNWVPERLVQRLREISVSVHRTGSYEHTTEEIEYGAQVAWRNSAKCVGRLVWDQLKVRDKRHVRESADIFTECVRHLNQATSKTNMEAVMTVFAPRKKSECWGTRFWNAQLVRFACYREGNGQLLGDAANEELTARIMELGWEPPTLRSAFDVLPVVLQHEGQTTPDMYELPEISQRLVDIQHPHYPELRDLGLKWCGVPTVSNFNLSLGGIDYVCCPFNGWFMESEVTRNLWERYNIKKSLCAIFGLDSTDPYSGWEERGFAELNRAVLYSFQRAKLSMVAHKQACEQFLTHIQREKALGREVPAQWSWVVPSAGGSTNSLWHREMRDFRLTPEFQYCSERYKFAKPGQKTGERQQYLREQSQETSMAKSEGHQLQESRNVLIMFGSGTGGCERYARHLGRLLKLVKPNVKSINDAVSSGALTHPQLQTCIVITSTFADGDAPANANFLKMTSLGSLDHLDFAVFAAGSRMYPTFAAFGKRLHRRLQAAGAHSMFPIVCGDEMSDQAQQFADFAAMVVQGICPDLDYKEIKTTKTAIEVRSVVNHLKDHEAPERLFQPVRAYKEIVGCPFAFQSVKPSSDGKRGRSMSENSKLQATLQFESGCPFSESVLSIKGPGGARLLPEGNEECHISTEALPEKDIELSMRVLGFTLVPVAINKNLLSAGAVSSTRLLRFDLANTGLEYNTGDHAKVWPLNSESSVDAMCRLIGEREPERRVEIVDRATGEDEDLGIPTPIRVRTLLRTYVDFAWRPVEYIGLLETMVACCTDVHIKSTLTLWLHELRLGRIEGATREESEANKACCRAREDMISANYPCITDMLTKFPSINLTLAHIIESCPRQKPRYYSISSGAKFSKGQYMELTVGVASDQTTNGKAREGLCSYFLASLVPGVDAAWVSIKHTTFKPPFNYAAPIMMIGTGTGLAPFIGFLQDKSVLQKQMNCEQITAPRATNKTAVNACPISSARTHKPLLSRRLSHLARRISNTGHHDKGNRVKLAPAMTMGNRISAYSFRKNKNSACSPKFDTRETCEASETSETLQMSLFYGCHNASDYLHRENLITYIEDEVLNRLSVAFSRPTSTGPNHETAARQFQRQDSQLVVARRRLSGDSGKQYVQETMGEDASLREALKDAQLHIYICGGTSMANDVVAQLCAIIQKSEELDNFQAVQRIVKMKAAGRLHTDCWGTSPMDNRFGSPDMVSMLDRLHERQRYSRYDPFDSTMDSK